MVKIPICLMTHDELYAKHSMIKDLPYFEDMLNNEEVIVIDGAILIDGLGDAIKKSSMIDKSSYLKESLNILFQNFLSLLI